MVTVGGLCRFAQKELSEAGIENAFQETVWLWEACGGADPRLEPEKEAEPAVCARFQALCEKRRQRYPLQYLLGRWPFLDFELAVGEGVLIPRGDTECVALTAAELAQEAPRPLTVLDLCAGTGALALAVQSRCPEADVTAVELSEKAFSWLQKNAAQEALRRGVSAVRTVLADALSFGDTLADASVSLIVSNPPYLTKAELEALQPEVRFEPRMALDGGGDGLDFYRALISRYTRCLRAGGWFVFEIGWKQAKDVQTLFEAAGYRTVSLRRDEDGNDRCVFAQK